MLWYKETDHPDALYVDAFAMMAGDWLKEVFPHYKYNRSFCDYFVDYIPSKNEEKSIKFREEGNALFTQLDWYAAMEKYNESLCYARYDSKNLGLAYANRSACFYQLEMYEECLADIEMAIKSGYPENFHWKLKNRKIDCQKMMIKGIQRDDFGTKLSFECDPIFPCMANVIRFGRDETGTYALYANEHIDIGKTIVLEKAVSTYVCDRFGLRCFVCLKTQCNLRPCPMCTAAMFCSDECYDYWGHFFECRHTYSKDKKLNGTVMFEVRLIMQVVAMFKKPSELIGFVETTLREDPEELPDHLMDTKSIYRAYLKQPILPSYLNTQEFFISAFAAFSTVLTYAQFKSYQKEKNRRFLMHLIMHHCLVSHRNAARKIVSGDSELCMSTSLMMKYFKHSCAPNVSMIDLNGHAVFYTHRPVKRGEKLEISILNILMEPTSTRRRMLLENPVYGGICNCIRCQGLGNNMQDIFEIITDRNFGELFQGTVFRDRKHLMMVIERCESFLTKNQNRAFSEPIAQLITYYTELCNIRALGPKFYI
ncbi:uncharacterized protein LOC116346156 [Contarinia nasturtii]|uniref:uncharacterized protein LOC116346156 n=1 Tax=Contarinia nasturtii TaxID=265458 RepID=UPI0012D4974C|nr:uncharacterized protein LOC116346156 [Contarinia nasturtii]